MRRAVGRWRCKSCLQASSRQLSTSAVAAIAPVLPEQSRLSYAPLRAPIQRYNALITRHANKGNLAQALRMAAELRESLAKSEQGPDVITYEALAKAFAIHGLYREALRLIDDAKGAGVEPDIGVFNQVLRAHIVADQPLSAVFEAMKADNIEPNVYTRELVIESYVKKKSVEPAVRGLIELATPIPSEASTSKLVYSERTLDFSKVSQETFDPVLLLVCDVGETKLASGLLKSYQQTALEPVSMKVLYHMVEAGIMHDDPTCTWKGIDNISSSGQNLTEGLAVAAINHFSKHALIDACDSVYHGHLLPLLSGYGGIQEWHIAPLVQANIGAGLLDEALQRFHELVNLPSRNSAVKIRPSWRMFHAGLQHLSVLEHILSQAQQWIEYRDEPLPIQLINALLKACGQHRLVEDQKLLAERVLTGQAKYPKPDLETFKILLEGCLVNHRSQTGDSSNISRAEEILDIMRIDYKRIKPDQILYELLIKLYLQGAQDQWEKAFDYLEEMKHYNIVPSAQIYIALLDKLLQVSSHTDPKYDDARIDLLLEEMASLSYLGGRRHEYLRTKLPNKFYEELGRDRIMEIRDNFFAS